MDVDTATAGVVVFAKNGAGAADQPAVYDLVYPVPVRFLVANAVRQCIPCVGRLLSRKYLCRAGSAHAEAGCPSGTLFWPLFLLTPRPLLLPLFAGLWLWQTYDIAFMTATASTWLPHEIIRTFILPHSHWLLLTLLAPLLLIRQLGRRLFADTSATQAGGVILDDGR